MGDKIIDFHGGSKKTWTLFKGLAIQCSLLSLICIHNIYYFVGGGQRMLSPLTQMFFGGTHSPHELCPCYCLPKNPAPPCEHKRKVTSLTVMVVSKGFTSFISASVVLLLGILLITLHGLDFKIFHCSILMSLMYINTSCAIVVD